MRGVIIPALAASTTKTELNEVGRELRDAKDSAPTRPHPIQPPANPLTAWANGLVDRVRDRVGGRA